MNWKHYLAIATPYLSAAGLAIAGVMAHSTNLYEAAGGVFLLGLLNHNSVYMAPPEKP